MPKYLVEASYTKDGVKGLIKDGGSARRDTVKSFIEAGGGKLEAFYFAFGDSDAIVIIDAPDNAGAAAASLAVNASGAVTVKTTVLLTPEEMDTATKQSGNYRPPGS